jgi:tRNA-2-methylthio-N6-dimethylallyladenosine synthase
MRTYGCQMNSSDSDTIADLLMARGFEQCDDGRDADVIVVNTCSVREKAEVSAENKIRELCAIKKKKALLWVIGCMAERVGEALKERQPKISRVIGAPELEYIEEQIDTFLSPLGSFSTQAVADSGNWSSFLPIMRGCDNFCTYCIVPHVRGREHSVDVSKLVEKATSLAKSGVKELTLLGQNVNSYKSDEIDFPQLLIEIQKVEGLERVRFMTSHPKDISDKLIETIASHPKLSNHIHLPVQCGSTEILKKMNRGYSREEYIERVAKIRELIPEADITTDVMVGFPGETEEQFQETLSLFKEVRFTTAFMYAYSSREGTGAAKYGDHIPHEVKIEQLNRLIELQTKITREIYAEMVGKEVEVFLSMKQKGDRGWVGQTFGSKRAVLESQDDSFGGKIIKAKVVKHSGQTLIVEEIK